MARKRKKVKHLKFNKGVLDFIINFILAIIMIGIASFIVILYLISQMLIKDDKISRIGEYTAQIVSSGSMTPTLGVGDTVIIKPKDNYVFGDIITFYIYDEEKNCPVSYTHRIVSVGNGFFYTKGDANNKWDDWIVDQSNIVGEVVYAVPKIGKLILKLSHISLKLYKMITIAIFAFLIIIILYITFKEVTAELTNEELRLIQITDLKKYDRKVRKQIKELKRRKELQDTLFKKVMDNKRK